MSGIDNRDSTLFRITLTEFCIEKRLWIMNVKKITSGGKQQTEKQSPPSTEVILGALPEVQESLNDKDSQTGVSTKNALSGTKLSHGWYVLRTTYGRERKAHAYITRNHGVSLKHEVKHLNSFCCTAWTAACINAK
jgi:hypothetical protein